MRSSKYIFSVFCIQHTTCRNINININNVTSQQTTLYLNSLENLTEHLNHEPTIILSCTTVSRGYHSYKSEIQVFPEYHPLVVTLNKT